MHVHGPNSLTHFRTDGVMPEYSVSGRKALDEGHPELNVTLGPTPLAPGPARLGAMTTEPNPGASAPKDHQPPAVEHLENHECWRLLRSVTVGRLAVWVDDHPDIFPINYKVDHGSLVFRTGDGTKLQAATGDTPVALEADGVDADSGIAWRVVTKGQAAPVKDQ